MEKIAFSLPLRSLVCPCAFVTLDQRHLIDGQIYPTGLPEQFYRLTARSLLCSFLGLLGWGQVKGRIVAVVAARASLFSATVILVGHTASPESLMHSDHQ